MTTACLKRLVGKKAVLLDLDDTLYSYAPCHQYALEESYRLYRSRGQLRTFRKFREAYESARRHVKRETHGQAASHSRLLYFQRMLEKELGKTDPVRTLALEAVYWKSFMRRMKVAPWARPLLRHCKANGKKVVVVTNLTTSIQLQKIRRLGLCQWIDYVVTSEEAGAEKPSARIFRLALKKVGCQGWEALVVGDDLEMDKNSDIDFCPTSTMQEAAINL